MPFLAHMINDDCCCMAEMNTRRVRLIGRALPKDVDVISLRNNQKRALKLRLELEYCVRNDIKSTTVVPL